MVAIPLSLGLGIVSINYMGFSLNQLSIVGLVVALSPRFACNDEAARDEPGKLALAVEFSRITFPYLLFISLVSLQGGVLNGIDRFAEKHWRELQGLLPADVAQPQPAVAALAACSGSRAVKPFKFSGGGGSMAGRA